MWLWIGIGVAVVVVIVIVIIAVMYMSTSAAAANTTAAKTAYDYSGTSGAVPLAPSTLAPPDPVWVDPYATTSGIPTSSVSPAPTASTYVPPVQPAVYVAPPVVKQPPSVYPVLYKKANYSGDTWTVPKIGQTSLTGSLKNEAVSVKIPLGWALRVYDKDDCTGKTALLRSDVADLSSFGLKNDIACVQLAVE